MSMRSGKIHPAKPVNYKPGPTITVNDPADFRNHGKTSGKTGANGVVKEAHGPIFVENSTHIPTMDADKPADQKSMGQEKGRVNLSDHKAATELTASMSGSGGPTDHEYFLKKSYEKSGKKSAPPKGFMK